MFSGLLPGCMAFDPCACLNLFSAAQGCNVSTGYSQSPCTPLEYICEGTMEVNLLHLLALLTNCPWTVP